MPSWIEIPAELFQVRTSPQPAAYWKSLHYFNLYRLIVAGSFTVGYALFGVVPPFGASHPALFFATSSAYVFFALLLIVPIRIRWPGFNLLLSGQVSADIGFIVVLMYASGGIGSGLGLLLLGPLVATGMVSRGRLALFHAAIASIALLLEQTVQVLKLSGGSAEYLQVSLTSMGFFATSGLAYVLTRRLALTENQVLRQRIDLENLAQVSQLVIQDMQDGVLVVDGEARLYQCNREAERLLKTPPLAAEKWPLGEYSPALLDCWLRWRNDPSETIFELTVPATAKRIQARFTGIGGDQMLGALIFLKDLSQIQARAEQLKLAALGRLTANIAHEIRNPLNSISHAAELLEEDENRDVTQLRLLEIIRDNTERLDRIVRNVLEINRRDRARPVALPLRDTLHQFVERFCETEKIPADCLIVAVEGEPVVRFDPHHLDQVLWNLCRNAWRYCRQEAGSIRLHAVSLPEEDRVKLDVTDDGGGIAEVHRTQLFEPFFTTDSTGTGLGLYIARELCEANSAALDYVEADRGAQFSIGCRREKG